MTANGAGRRDLLLEIKGLKTHFFTDEGVVKAVDGADFPIARGKTVCVVGESGCGKSVTARSILQIVDRPGRIVAGKILLYRESGDVVDLAALPPTGKAIRAVRGKEIAMIFQEPMSSLSPVHTIGNQIVEMMRLHLPLTPAQTRERAAELLERVGIRRRRNASTPMCPAQRRHAAAGDDRHGALLPSQSVDRRRAHHRPRRDHRGHHPRPDQGVAADLNMTVMFVTHDLGVVAEIADDVV